MALLKENHLLSEQGNAFFNKKSALLIVHEEPSQYRQICKLIRQLDRRPKQVEITAHIVTMTEESLLAMGVNWRYEGHPSETIHSIETGLGLTSPAVGVGLTIASVAGYLLNLQLAALEAENRVEIIASPRLLTTHLVPASIRQGTEIPYEVASGQNGTTTIEFKQAVLGLEVTPRVLEEHYLELSLHISQNAAGHPIKRSEGGEALTINTEEIKTQVIVKEGKTLVLGGIFQQNRSQIARQIPTVHKIPVLGSLFQPRQKKAQRKELVIFITPKILSDT